MAVQNLMTARFVLQRLQAELDEFDRDIPVARNLQVGDVTDALLAVLSNPQFLRLTLPARSSRRRHAPSSPRPAIAKRTSRTSRVSRTA